MAKDYEMREFHGLTFDDIVEEVLKLRKENKELKEILESETGYRV